MATVWIEERCDFDGDTDEVLAVFATAEAAKAASPPDQEWRWVEATPGAPAHWFARQSSSLVLLLTEHQVRT